jgi:hypothetical protein
MVESWKCVPDGTGPGERKKRKRGKRGKISVPGAREHRCNELDDRTELDNEPRGIFVVFSPAEATCDFSEERVDAFSIRREYHALRRETACSIALRNVYG